MSLRRKSRRAGFTLVELLTVIGIISLLISILLPSLSRARAQAKKVKVEAQLSAIVKGLEMFRNDFNQYPDSSYGADPIDWSSGPVDGALLSGAHWLARAMAGHDIQGVDTKATMLKRGFVAAAYPQTSYDDPDPNNANKPGVNSDRKGTYVDGPIFARDTDAIKIPQITSAISTPPATDRIVMIDGYNYPILYYRANSRAKSPFQTISPSGAVPPGVYVQEDNAAFTGGDLDPGDTGAGTSTATGFDFAATGVKHGLSHFPPAGTPLDPVPAGTKGKNFVEYLLNETTYNASTVVKASNNETFILISAGNDGIYGTDDDVNSFKGGL